MPVGRGADISPKSKTAATWLAFVGGGLGLYRFYLYGWRDVLGWLHPLPTLIGVYGALRMRALGVDDRLAWALVPILGLMLSGTMLVAIVYGLTPDAKWDARWRPAGPPSASGWGVVLAIIFALMIGAAILLGTIAFAGERYFELLLEDQSRSSRATP